MPYVIQKLTMHTDISNIKIIVTALDLPFTKMFLC